MLSNEIILAKTGIDLAKTEQGSDDWHKLRLGVITASEACYLLKDGRKKGTWSDSKTGYMNRLIGEILTGEHKEIKARALDWGNNFEDEARTLFGFYNDLIIDEVPIVFKDESMRCACSPDGLASDGLGVEIKCPVTTEVFVNFAANGFDGMKDDYKAQVQYSMWATNKEQWHFVNYDPRIPEGKNIASIIVDRDEEIMKQFDDAVPEFIEKMDGILNNVFGVKFGDQWR